MTVESPLSISPDSCGQSGIKTETELPRCQHEDLLDSCLKIGLRLAVPETQSTADNVSMVHSGELSLTHWPAHASSPPPGAYTLLSCRRFAREETGQEQQAAFEHTTVALEESDRVKKGED